MNLIKILMITPKQKGEPVNVLKNLLWKLLITAYVENITMSCPIKTVFNIFLLIYIETRAISWEWRSVHGFEKHVLFHFWKLDISHYRKKKTFPLERFRHKFYSSEKIFTIIRTRQHSAPLHAIFDSCKVYVAIKRASESFFINHSCHTLARRSGNTQENEETRFSQNLSFALYVYCMLFLHPCMKKARAIMRGNLRNR